VWDLRTFHLLRTLPALDKCDLHFNKTADVLYSVSFEFERDEEVHFESSYNTMDATNYASIGKNLFPMSLVLILI
jgi:DDB1- and CUL4-associated factor 1